MFLEDLCFEAQQAAEKALKAVCLHLGIDFPKTHSLVVLVDMVEGGGLEVPPDVRDAVGLTAFAVQARYPDWGEAVTPGEYEQALRQAERVVGWAQATIR